MYSDTMIEVTEDVFFDRVKVLKLKSVQSLECQDLMDNYVDSNGNLVGQHEMIGCGNIFSLSESVFH